MRIAIACPGVGLVQRGFERLFSDLFHVMKDQDQNQEFTLFKGGGVRNKNENVLFFANRNSPLTKLFPLHKLFGRTRYHSECFTFAIAMLPHLFSGKYHIFHLIDPPLVRFLFHIRNRFRLNFKVLYTHGVSMPTAHYPPSDHVHHIAKVTYDKDLAYGLSLDHMTLLPCGIHPERFEARLAKQELRKKYSVPEGCFVVLCVAALNRSQKRVDYLIDEAAAMKGNFLLWLDGSLDFGDPDLINYAKTRLRDICRITHVPSDTIGELYNLADVMVLPSLDEAFGLVIIEAASIGVPVITHNGPHFQWLQPSEGHWVNMEERGALTNRLSFLMNNRESLDVLHCQEQIRKRFDWKNLREQYQKLYYRIDDLSIPVQEWKNRV